MASVRSRGSFLKAAWVSPLAPAPDCPPFPVRCAQGRSDQAVRGDDPMARARTGPFAEADHLARAASVGLDTNDPRPIEILGLARDAACHLFGSEPEERA